MTTLLFKSLLDTPLGPLLAVADTKRLYLLEFADSKQVERKIQRIQQIVQATNFISEDTAIITSIKHELELYFTGKLQEFTMPLFTSSGTPFQKRVWQEIQALSYGQTQSYLSLAKKIQRPSAYRAVAQANSANFFIIIIPCHRVIYQNGSLGGYSGGIARKQWLLNHEKSTALQKTNYCESS